MKNLLEIHILQNFAPANLNRDDTGAPKDTMFGEFLRGRVSSQSWKRSVRKYISEFQLLSKEELATRTKRLSKIVEDCLVDNYSFKREEAIPMGQLAINCILKSDPKKPHLSKTLVFISQNEGREFARICNENKDQLTEFASETKLKAMNEIQEVEERIEDIKKESENAEDEKEKEKLKKDLKELQEELKKKKKDAGKTEVPAEIKKEFSKVIGSARRSVDIALFGRMLAELKPENADRDNAACQVSHAISTNAIKREFDFFTAVDELNQDDSGAGMMGTVEFNSSCYYRYSSLDIDKLFYNLNHEKDDDLPIRGIEAFLKAFVKSKPTGKQNTFAAHNDPDYVVFTVRQNADPRNLANAFEKPIGKNDLTDKSLTEVSINRFETKWEKLDKAYGQAGKTFILNLADDTKSKVGTSVDSLDHLIQQTIAEVKKNIRG
ncbi:putative CRISPR-associated protein Cas7/Cse4/CasC, subtype TIGR01869 [Leptospira weilii serovar Ranarum str. ICFT]|uniref:CRISPR-associated protein Cas7/Cse4/CasC, subtype TIGR01869 n=1 Tax=Leptospira weilii serovar Ranarum str. ICFT TaxID=1218598 RepID=N1WL78_9LEPT|nr:type I-E CRISPR-associated protein Cas7/Cse4/CasC [Leptospira weilii]EMY77977.1 putative CRISPR-associated protein Cas7/Cse4/CasC, subtype TIGR01869 [Leptospira weilii serovar Ranarum str. ICFT]